jgi:hypothetical protein
METRRLRRARCQWCYKPIKHRRRLRAHERKCKRTPITVERS